MPRCLTKSRGALKVMPVGTRDREDPARGGVTRQEDPSNGSTAMQVDPTPAPFPLISAADFQALVQQGEALMRLADRPPGTWGSQEQHWGRLAGPRLPSAMDIDSTGTTPETAPRAAAPTAQQRQQQSGQHTLHQQHQAEQQQQQQQQQQKQQQAQREQQERQEQEQQQQRQQELYQAQQQRLQQQHLQRRQQQQQQQQMRPQPGQQQQQHRREHQQPSPPRQTRAERAWTAWKKDNALYDNMAYALDEHELKAGETKESVIREFYAFLGSSPLARDNHQGGTGARGTASLPRYAILWLEERYKIGGYGSDTSSGGLLSTRKSSRTRRAPDPERQYGSRETSSPRGAPA